MSSHFPGRCSSTLAPKEKCGPSPSIRIAFSRSPSRARVKIKRSSSTFSMSRMLAFGVARTTRQTAPVFQLFDAHRSCGSCVLQIQVSRVARSSRPRNRWLGRTRARPHRCAGPSFARGTRPPCGSARSPRRAAPRPRRRARDSDRRRPQRPIRTVPSRTRKPAPRRAGSR